MTEQSEEHLITDHDGKISTLQDDIEKTQHDHAALNAMAGSLDYFDRYSSASNLTCRFFMMGFQSTDGITLSAVDGGGFVWVSVGLVGAMLAIMGSLQEHENRKKELEETLKKCQLRIDRCQKLSEQLEFDDNRSNEDLLHEIILKQDVLQKRKSRKMIASLMNKNPYSPEFLTYLEEYKKTVKIGLAEFADAEFSDVEDQPKKVTVKQIVSYIVNFISNFGTGSGFVYWGAVIFGVPAPFGWVLMLIGVLVGIIVGSIFVAQQVRMDLQHKTLNEAIDDMHESLKTREKLLKSYKKINKHEEIKKLEDTKKPVPKIVEPNVESIPVERQHLYAQEIPKARKHLFRAGAISYNAVLGFVIGFGLVMTFAFVTGGAGLIPGIIIGLAMSGYFVYSGADRAKTVEEEEAAKRLMLQQVQVDYETHWNTPGVSNGYAPVSELGKSVPRLLLDMIKAFNLHSICKEDGNKRCQNQNKLLDLLETVTKIQLNKDKELSDAFFNELYVYFLHHLKNEMPDDEDEEEWVKEIKDTILTLKKKVLKSNDNQLKEPKKPETVGEQISDWCKKTFTRITVPKGIRRLFVILGAFTLGAAIPFMAISGGIALPVCVAIFMATVLTVFIVREVMDYKRMQAMKAMDEEIQKYEIIDRTRKLIKLEKRQIKEPTPEPSQYEVDDAINESGYGQRSSEKATFFSRSNSKMNEMHPPTNDFEGELDSQVVLCN